MGRVVKFLMAECACSVLCQRLKSMEIFSRRCSVWANEPREASSALYGITRDKGSQCKQSAIIDTALANNHMDKAFLCTPLVVSPV
jgi:hypothetical protein